MTVQYFPTATTLIEARAPTKPGNFLGDVPSYDA